MSNAAEPSVVVIGCGNPTRGDDGVGPDIIRRLAVRGLGRLDDVRLHDAGTDGMAVLFAARGCTTLIIVDACRSGAAPGAMFEVPAHEIATPTPPALGTHELCWEHALAAGRRICGDAFPADTTVFLIEVESLEFGIALSAPVNAAAERVAARIEASVRAKIAAIEPEA